MGDFEGETGCGPTHHFACKCRETAFAKLAAHALAWQFKKGQLTLHGVEIVEADVVLEIVLKPFHDEREELFKYLGHPNAWAEQLSEPSLELVEQMHDVHADMTMLRDENSRLRDQVARGEEGLELKMLRDENIRLKDRIKHMQHTL